ncbi:MULTISPECIES: PA1571 family protein [Pseudomonas]|jgi:hypothetical protein|uniref:Multifunctional fatty acid oxidation complex subunit alpha n=1 Tax=Pseudomonas marincola TaxID=437900 RepID=A0A1I7C254_9PSED|nr:MULTISPECIES: PA1571 family protein [Pseudomonas]CAE6921978.1 conserved protein of unknown function [Pseudomonas marincola]SFT93494.1 hypothetical protein SAMN05216264_106247 [Pseudomonas marincola]|tara:strand:- start:174 stop:350 length:177 start_codon:yes stop_codon:yes gene_type:complete
MNTSKDGAQSSDTASADQPVGGAIIDDEGHEVPITEEMIQQACEKLEVSRTGATEKHD